MKTKSQDISLSIESILIIWLYPIRKVFLHRECKRSYWLGEISGHQALEECCRANVLFVVGIMGWFDHVWILQQILHSCSHPCNFNQLTWFRDEFDCRSCRVFDTRKFAMQRKHKKLCLLRKSLYIYIKFMNEYLYLSKSVNKFHSLVFQSKMWSDKNKVLRL